jgi:hypothetical protein
MVVVDGLKEDDKYNFSRPHVKRNLCKHALLLTRKSINEVNDAGAHAETAIGQYWFQTVHNHSYLILGN